MASSALKTLLVAGALAASATAAMTTTAAAIDDATFRLETAADLARLCAAQPDQALFGPAIQMCHGFMTGAHQVHELFAAAMGEGLYCLDPATAPTRDQAAAAFVTWIQANPEAAGRPAGGALLEWAALTYPCN